MLKLSIFRTLKKFEKSCSGKFRTWTKRKLPYGPVCDHCAGFGAKDILLARVCHSLCVGLVGGIALRNCAWAQMPFANMRLLRCFMRRRFWAAPWGAHGMRHLCLLLAGALLVVATQAEYAIRWVGSVCASERGLVGAATLGETFGWWAGILGIVASQHAQEKTTRAGVDV